MKRILSLLFLGVLVLICINSCFASGANVAMNGNDLSPHSKEILPPNHGTVHIILTGCRAGMEGAKIKIDWCNRPYDGGYEVTVSVNSLGLYEAVLSGAAGDHTFTLTPVVSGYHGETRIFFIRPVTEIWRTMRIYRSNPVPQNYENNGVAQWSSPLLMKFFSSVMQSR